MGTQSTLYLPGHIRARNFRKSEPLQRLLNYLSDGKDHSTLEISDAMRCCAAHTDIAELRAPKNGFKIPRRYYGRSPAGRQINLYQMTADDVKRYNDFKQGLPV